MDIKETDVDFDQLAFFQKPADLDLHCFQKRVLYFEKVMHTVHLLDLLG